MFYLRLYGVIFQEAIGGCYVWYSFRNLTTALTRRQPPDLLSLDDLTTYTLFHEMFRTFFANIIGLLAHRLIETKGNVFWK